MRRLGRESARQARIAMLLVLAGTVGAAEAADTPTGTANTWSNGRPGAVLGVGRSRGRTNSGSTIGSGTQWAGVEALGSRVTSHSELNISHDASATTEASARTSFQLSVESVDGYTYGWTADAKTSGWGYAQIAGQTAKYQPARISGSADVAALAALLFGGDIQHEADVHMAAHSKTQYTHAHDATVSGAFSAGVNVGDSVKDGPSVGGSASATRSAGSSTKVTIETTSQLGSASLATRDDPNRSEASAEGAGNEVRVDCLASGKATYRFTQEGDVSAVGRGWADIAGEVGLVIIATYDGGGPTTGGGDDGGPITGGGSGGGGNPLTGIGPFTYRVRAHPAKPLWGPTEKPPHEGDGTLRLDPPSEPVEDEDGPPRHKKPVTWRAVDHDRNDNVSSGGSTWTLQPDTPAPGTTTSISQITQGLVAGRVWIERAIVTSPSDARGTFFVQAPGGGAWSGLAVEGGAVGVAPDVGNTLALVGEVRNDEYGLRLELRSDQDALYLEPETPSVTVLLLPVADWEPYVGALIELGPASVQAPLLPDSPLVTDGGILVGTQFDDTAAEGGAWSRLRGVVVEGGALPKVAPRAPSDLVQ